MNLRIILTLSITCISLTSSKKTSITAHRVIKDVILKDYVEILPCTYKLSTYDSIPGEINICEVTKLEFQVNHNETKFALSSSFDDVFGIQIHSKIVRYFPQGIGEIFTKLQVISMKNNRMREIHREDFKSFVSLKLLDLEGNKIQIIEENLFASNVDLEVINFSGNLIKQIHKGVFENLAKLKSLNFERNLCISGAEENDHEDVLDLVKETQLKCSETPVKTVGADPRCFNYSQELKQLKIHNLIILSLITVNIAVILYFFISKSYNKPEKAFMDISPSTSCVGPGINPYKISDLTHTIKFQQIEIPEYKPNVYENPMKIEGNEYLTVTEI